jgi:hypothetical protein
VKQWYYKENGHIFGKIGQGPGKNKAGVPFSRNLGPFLGKINI